MVNHGHLCMMCIMIAYAMVVCALWMMMLGMLWYSGVADCYRQASVMQTSRHTVGAVLPRLGIIESEGFGATREEPGHDVFY